MKILVLNCGSSSVKYKLFDIDSKSVLAQGGAEKIGLEDSFLKLTLPNGEKVILKTSMPEHHSAIQNILNVLTGKEYGCIESFDEIDAVGHRVVHGGEKFNKSVLITDEVIEKIKECYDIAPLHNPVNMAGIEAISKLMPTVPQVGVFDTAFHQTMPAHAYMYALPYDLYKKYGIRRYGFHGTSHRYVSKRACEFVGVPYEKQRIITCHIGNGGSITAIKDGKSVDTSMGMTPVEGLMMGTRSGDVDAGVLTYLMDKEHLDSAGVANLVNKKSGVAGISGLSSDMRDIEAGVAAKNERAILALQMYEYRITKYIGAYAAALGGVDIIVFTGGVGENQTITREAVCKPLAFMGVEIDPEINKQIHGTECVISTPASKVKVVVIPTDEEYMIASDTKAVLSGKMQ